MGFRGSIFLAASLMALSALKLNAASVQIALAGQLRYQGKPLSGRIDLAILSYEKRTGGAWQDRQLFSGVQVNRGRFRIELALSPSVAADSGQQFLEFRLRPSGSDLTWQVMQPRQPVVVGEGIRVVVTGNNDHGWRLTANYKVHELALVVTTNHWTNGLSRDSK